MSAFQQVRSIKNADPEMALFSSQPIITSAVNIASVKKTKSSLQKMPTWFTNYTRGL